MGLRLPFLLGQHVNFEEDVWCRWLVMLIQPVLIRFLRFHLVHTNITGASLLRFGRNGLLQISVSEVLNRVFTAGVGERNSVVGTGNAAPCTEIPSVGSMFAMVKKVRPLCRAYREIARAHQLNILVK